jgi:hypothetical protein
VLHPRAFVVIDEERPERPSASERNNHRALLPFSRDRARWRQMAREKGWAATQCGSSERTQSTPDGPGRRPGRIGVV